MRIIVVAGLSNHKLHSKLIPLLSITGVHEIILVRRRPLTVPGVRNYCLPEPWRQFFPLAELYRMGVLLWLCLVLPQPKLLIGIHMIPHGVYAGLMGWLFNIRTVQLLIGKDLHATVNNRLLRTVLKRADVVGVRGRYSSNQVAQIGIQQQDIFIPPNVLDISVYAPQESEKRPFDLIYVGTLIDRKQPDLLLHAVAKLKTKHPSIRLALVGDGPLRPALETQALQLGIEDSVHFIGPVASEEIPYYLNQSHIFIMASKREGLPMAMIEALSCELPVIVPDVDDITGVAKHGINALVVSPTTAGNLAAAADALLQNPDLYAQLKAGAAQTRLQLTKTNSLAAASKAWERILQSNSTNQH